MQNLKISVRLEGGLGDCLLGCRFIPAIKEKYPNSEFFAYIDSEGKTFQKEVIQYLYPTLFKEIKIVPNKKYKEFWIKSQFGTENQKGFWQNVPDEIWHEMNNYDKFYNLHIDSLEWLQHDYDYFKYFRRFLPPEIKPENHLGDYIVSHLYSSTSKEHKMEEWYTDRVVLLLDKLASELGLKHYIISTPEINDLYKKILKQTQVTYFVNGEIDEICDLIINSKGFLGTDSGFRFIGYSCSIPTLSYSKYSPAPHQMQPSHLIRWNPMPEFVFPLHFNVNYIVNIFKNMITDRKFMLIPQVLDDFDNVIINRNYEVDTEKTK